MTETGLNRVLLVGDDEFATAAERAIEHRFEAVTLDHEAEMYDALDVLDGQDVDCIVSEYRLADGDGLAFLRRVTERDGDCEFLLYPSEGDEQVASEAIAAGVTDYVPQRTGTPNVETLVDRLAAACEPAPDGRDRLRTLVEEAADPVFVVDAEGTVVEASASVSESLGYDPDDLVGETVWSFEVALDRTALRDRLDDLSEGETTTFDGRHRRADGSEFPVEVRVRRVDVDGQRRFLAQARDISERRAAQSRLEASEQALRDLYEVVSDESSPFEAKLQSIVEIGCERLDLPVGYLATIEDDRQHVEVAVGDHELLQPGESTPLSAAYCRKTIESDDLLAVQNAPEEGWAGDPAYERFELGCYLGGRVEVDGELYGTLCFAGDATRERTFTEAERTFTELLVEWVSYQLSRRKYERELERERDLFERTQEIASVGAWELDVEAGTISWTTEACRIHDVPVTFEPTLDEAIEFYHPEDRDRVREAVQTAIQTGEPYDVEARIETARGETRWVRTQGEPRFEDGEAVRLRGTIQDITDRKERQEELSAYAQAVNAAGDGIYQLDTDGRIQMVNDQLVEMTGYDREQLLGEHVSLVMSEDDVATGRERIRQLLDDDGERVGSLEMDIQPEAGGAIPAENRIAVLRDEDGAYAGSVGVVRDISERVQREERIRTQREELRIKNRAINEADIGITITDPTREDNPIVYANDGFERVTGYSPEYAEGRNCRFLQGEGTDPKQVAQLREAVEAGEATSVELRNYRQDGTEFWNRVEITPVTDDEGEVTNFFGFQRDVTERKEYERGLAALHDATSDLLRADSAGEIADRTVEAATRALATDTVAVYLFDEETNRLEPAAYSEATAELLGEVPAFEPDEAIAWEVFVEGEGRIYDDVRDDESVYDAATPLRTEVLVPLGDHGVLLAGRTERTDVADRMLDLTETLARNCEAALSRAEREQKLRERDRELREQNTRLEQLQEINDEIRQIDHALVGADTREEIEEIVCERLADIDRFAFAWIGERDASGEQLVPRSWDGDGGSYLDALEGSIEGAEPTARALRDGEPVTVDAVADDLRAEPWRSDALSRDFLSALSVPLTYDEMTYGALSVYASRPQGFNEMSRSVLEELAATVAYAINAVERKQALLSDARVELEFGVEAGTTPLVGLAADLDCELELDSAITRGDGTTLLYVTASGVESQAVTAAAAERVTITGVRELGATGDGHRFEVRVTGETLATAVADHGGRLESLGVDAGQGQVTVTLPERADVRSFVERFTDQTPGAELFARRRTTASGGPTDGGPSDKLTPRQRETLEAAYHAGFFEWPRQSTGEEIADSLDVAPPTFLEHLRRAESKLVDDLFEKRYRRNPADD